MIGSIFSLKKSDLLHKTLSATASEESVEEVLKVQPDNRVEEGKLDERRALTCHVCGIGVGGNTERFADVEEQREHFKTDWHRYNVHRSVQQKPPVTRKQFEHLLEADDVSHTFAHSCHAMVSCMVRVQVSSISGSDSEEEEMSVQRVDNEDRGMVCFTFESENTDY